MSYKPRYFAVLFVYLLFYVFKEHNKREKDYQNLVKEIISLAQKLNLKDYSDK
ncbi:MAG: BhlA/UviB family holin-like peptide [Sarcina sp.]